MHLCICFFKTTAKSSLFKLLLCHPETKQLLQKTIVVHHDLQSVLFGGKTHVVPQHICKVTASKLSKLSLKRSGKGSSASTRNGLAILQVKPY